MRTASWVIVNKHTGKAVFETFNQNTANAFNGVNCKAINAAVYEAIPILQWLQSLNRKS